MAQIRKLTIYFEEYTSWSHLAAYKAEPARHHDKATPFATGKVGYNTIRR